MAIHFQHVFNIRRQHLFSRYGIKLTRPASPKGKYGIFKYLIQGHFRTISPNWCAQLRFVYLKNLVGKSRSWEVSSEVGYLLNFHIPIRLPNFIDSFQVHLKLSNFISFPTSVLLSNWRPTEGLSTSFFQFHLELSYWKLSNSTIFPSYFWNWLCRIDFVIGRFERNIYYETLNF